MTTKECEYDPDHLYHSHMVEQQVMDELRAQADGFYDEVMRLRAENQRHEQRLREVEVEWVGRFEALEAENERLRAEHENIEKTRLNWAQPLRAVHVTKQEQEIERLRAHIDQGCALVNAMDERMPEQATEDADGWINSYRIPVGPWHRLLGWARGGMP